MLVGGFRKALGGMFNRRLAAGFADSEKDIKMRLKSVSSTKKITKAMKMVATAKMKSELDRLENGKDFGVGMVPAMFKNDEYMTRRVGEHEIKKTLLVPVTTDRGLCGGVNAVIIRDVRDFLNSQSDKSRFGILPIGEKGATGLSRNFGQMIIGSINEVVSPVNFYNAAAIAHLVANLSEGYDEIVISYNEFINTISQKIRKINLVSKPQFLKMFDNIVRYEMSEPDTEYAKHYFYEFYLASNLYYAMLNNATSEQASRMNAMENATKNAGEIIDALTLKYNKARQARITMELIEIISGANAL